MGKSCLSMKDAEALKVAGHQWIIFRVYFPSHEGSQREIRHINNIVADRRLNWFQICWVKHNVRSQKTVIKVAGEAEESTWKYLSQTVK